MIINKDMNFKYLEWDSSFFNKKIGLLELPSELKYIEYLDDCDLIYVVSNCEFLVELINFELTFSETKIDFSKKGLKKNKVTDKNIFSVLPNDFPNKQIYDLTLESGKFSRFRLDSKFKKNDFKKLYRKWIDNSYTKEIADNILVYKYKDDNIGFITYKVFENYARIGLMAISPKYQGKGIGIQLINAVENELITLGINELRISTQLHNEAACRFYKKAGYKIIEIKILKHYWKL